MVGAFVILAGGAILPLGIEPAIAFVLIGFGFALFLLGILLPAGDAA